MKTPRSIIREYKRRRSQREDSLIVGTLYFFDGIGSSDIWKFTGIPAGRLTYKLAVLEKNDFIFSEWKIGRNNEPSRKLYYLSTGKFMPTAGGEI